MITFVGLKNPGKRFRFDCVNHRILHTYTYTCDFNLRRTLNLYHKLTKKPVLFVELSHF